MTLTFFSNYLNHHQLPFCLEMVKRMKDSFKFVATQKISDERIKLGYEDMNKKYDFVVRSYENEEEAYKLALESDVVIIGSAPDKYIRERLKKGKIVLRYSERVLKNGFKLKLVISMFIKRTILEGNNTYLLCSSAYSASDYNLAGAYKNKTYKWGYFPEVKEYNNISSIIKGKINNSILWVARFIDLKHPELVVKTARKLESEGYDFNISMIGIGDTQEKIKKVIKDSNLNDKIKLLGSMPPDSVRKYMEKSQMFLFTSDRREGWGAVLNEAMNSACAVVASHEIGSVPFLITDGENGLIYKDGDFDDLYNKVKLLLDNNKYMIKIQKNAYKTMIDLWNPKVAAERLIKLSEKLSKNKKCDRFKNGPCSRADVIKDNWYN